MFDKIKEKIKKWWGKFLVIIGIGTMAVLAATTVGNSIPQFSQLLKVSKENILWSNEYTEYERDEEDKIISQKQIVSYAYKSDELAPVLKDEIIEKRTENIVIRNLGGNKRSAQSGYNFYKEDGEWKQIKFATTTKEKFDKTTKVSWIKMVLAADTGATNPGTTADDDTVGTIAWFNTNNVKTQNFSYSFTDGGVPYTSHYLKATNFGFSIPASSIDGIVVDIWKQGGDEPDSGNGVDSSIKLVKADGNYGTGDRADEVTNWPFIEAYVTHGDVNDLWDDSWTPTDINHSNFGVGVSVFVHDASLMLIDHIRITVYYTEEAPAVEEEIKPIPLGLF